jgi:hypothetical protein
MQTRTESGDTRYEKALDRAVEAIQQYPADKMIVIEFSDHPQLLVRPDDTRDPVAAVQASSPTWYADGTTQGLLAMMGSLGGVSQFDRIVVLTDKPMTGLPPQTEQIVLSGGENVGITAFSVRVNPDGSGVTAYVRLLNATDIYVDSHIRISDGENQTTLSLILPPRESDTYILPFPNSRGTVFTATLEHADDLGIDNRRFFALDRPIDVRLNWVGERNRYLLAALQASAPMTEVDDPASADLIIVNKTESPPIDHGVGLLIQSGLEGVATLGDVEDAGSIVTRAPDSPLLRSIDPDDLRIREMYALTFDVPAHVLLESNGNPVLAEFEDGSKRLIFLATDLMSTNLPITVDFPLFVRNLVQELVRIPPELSFRTAEVGDIVSLQGRGLVQSLVDASGEDVAYSKSLLTFIPESPGVYTLTTDRGAFALAVDSPASETALGGVAQSMDTGETVGTSKRWVSLWPYLLAAAILLLLAEAYLYLGLYSPARRST